MENQDVNASYSSVFLSEVKPELLSEKKPKTKQFLKLQITVLSTAVCFD